MPLHFKWLTILQNLMQEDKNLIYRVCQHAATKPDRISLHVVANHLNINRLRLQINNTYERHEKLNESIM